MRIGLFGGTFDPVHVGHLILAEQCRTQAKLDEVWFLPSYEPPHKSSRAVTRFEQRCEMLTLATAGQPAFRIETIEKELPAPSYTAKTLHELNERHPGHEFHLLLGADSLVDLPTWYEPQAVIDQAGLIVVPRPGVILLTAEMLASALGLDAARIRMRLVSSPLVDVSSRDLRRLVAGGHSIRYMVPRSVEEYVRERKLYLGK